MDQKTITDALRKALVNGSGTLDDLDALLKRAQEDIVKAKEEQKAAAAAAEQKRGKEIAELANRLLEGKITDDDAAYVINAWMRANGYTGDGLSGKDLHTVFDDTRDMNKLNRDFNAALDSLANSFTDFAKTLGIDPNRDYKNKKPTQDPDDVINNFLEKFGLK